MSTISLPAQTETLVNGSTAAGSLSLRGSTLPLKSTGVLDKYSHFDNTPTIGRQFDELQLTDLLDAENSDELIKELAIISASSSFFPISAIELTPLFCSLRERSRLLQEPVHRHRAAEEGEPFPAFFTRTAGANTPYRSSATLSASSLVAPPPLDSTSTLPSALPISQMTSPSLPLPAPSTTLSFVR